MIIYLLHVKKYSRKPRTNSFTTAEDGVISNRNTVLPSETALPLSNNTLVYKMCEISFFDIMLVQ